MQKDIGAYIASHYKEYPRDANGTRYACTGSPEDVADDLADYQQPEARADNDKNQYLRYSNNIVTVGPDGNRPCSIRVESLTRDTATARLSSSAPGSAPDPRRRRRQQPRRPRRNEIRPRHAKEILMYVAISQALEIGNVDLNPILGGVAQTILYFLVGMAVLIAGFVMVDVLTPGKLRQWCSSIAVPTRWSWPARCIALAIVIISAIVNSYSSWVKDSSAWRFTV